jgi:hypothetical protein
MKKLLLCSLALLTLSACGGGGGSSSKTPSISISPASASLGLNSNGLNNTFPFKAIVLNLSDMSVTWQVNGVKGGNSTVGTIDSSGNFTAPTKIPTSNPVSVTAVSNAQSSLTATSMVTLVPVTLSGQYAFSFSGTESKNALSFFVAGSFTADGAGNIIGGVEDINSNSAKSISKALTLSGTYTIGDDGRGMISFNSAGNTQTLAFVIETANHAQIIWFDNAANGSGTIDKQASAAFSLNSLKGNYAFGFDGVDGSGFTLSWVGTFTLATGAVTAGQSDLNDSGTVLAKKITGGSFNAPDTNGRGTGTIDFAGVAFNYAYYIVSASKLALIQIDPQDGVVGTAELQASQNFSSQSLAGNYAFSLGGVNAAGAVAEGGQFSASGVTLSGEVTENNGGTGIVTTGAGLSGSNLGIVSNGRGMMTLSFVPTGTENFVFYMVSTTKAFVLETDGFQVTSGQLLAQSGSPFQASSLSGNFGFQVSGIAFTFTGSSAPIDKSGQFFSDGKSAISGTEDLNAPGFTPGSLTIGSGSTYTVNNTAGRGSINVVTQNGSTTLDFYCVSPSQIFLIGTDTTQVTLGAGQSQPF